MLKVLFIVLAVGAGIFGAVTLFQGFQPGFTGGAIEPTYIMIGLIGIFLSWLWIKRARSL
jgi:phosphotransferase system  glucose/maltose/N-acetylglucosamine-specific IIC component